MIDLVKGQPGQLADLGFQRAFWLAYRGLRAWWWVRGPRTHGALVAVWVEGQLLLVKNSYRSDYTFPGGFVNAGERADEAAVRELREELGLHVDAARLREVYVGVVPYEQRDDKCTIFELDLDRPPEVELDMREVVGAWLCSPAEAEALPLVPHVRHYLCART